MEEQNFDALFNPTIEMGDSKKQNDDYQVGADKGKAGVYQSVIRFIPWHKSPQNSIMEKWVSWLVDPVTQRGRFVDCPSSVGKPSVLQDMYWKLKKSESVQMQKKAQVFSRRHNFAALIQVIKDENQPELEGQILVYRFGKKIWEKINSEMKPVIGDPHNPFDLLNGKLFNLTITKVSGYNNYDQSKFLDKRFPLAMVEDGKMKPISADTDKHKVLEYLKEHSPDLNKYSFKEWDQDTKDYVNGVIGAVTGTAAKSNNMADINSNTSGSNPTGNSASEEITSESINIEELGDNSASDLGLGDLPDIPDLGDSPSNNNQGISGNLDEALTGL